MDGNVSPTLSQISPSGKLVPEAKQSSDELLEEEKSESSSYTTSIIEKRDQMVEIQNFKKDLKIINLGEKNDNFEF